MWPWCAKKHGEMKKDYLISNIKNELKASKKFKSIKFLELNKYGYNTNSTIDIRLSAKDKSGRGYLEFAGTNLSLGLAPIPVDVNFEVVILLKNNTKIIDTYKNNFVMTQYLSAASDLQEYKKDAAKKNSL